MTVDPHRLAELRSVAFHRAVAERIRKDPGVLERARRRVASESAQGRSSGAAREWSEILSGPTDSICEFLLDPSERATRLRQSTPFAGAIPARERWRIWREVRASAEEQAAG